MKKYFFISIIFLFALSFSCSDSDNPEDNFVTTLNILNENGDDITIVPYGIPVTFNFGFENITQKVQTVKFTSGQLYDLEVYNSQGMLVWNFANDVVFPAAITELVFNPGEIKIFEEIWDQTSNEGVQVPAGIYDVYVNRNWNTGIPSMTTGPVHIEICESITGAWNWYETTGGIGGITETPESTGETRRVVFEDNGDVTFYTNNAVTLSSTYTMASEDTIFSTEPLPVLIIEGDFVYVYSLPSEDVLELQENVYDGFTHNYTREY